MLLAFEGRERAQQSELEGMWKLQESKSGIGLREMRLAESPESFANGPQPNCILL
jgi:hypothetical protein